MTYPSSKDRQKAIPGTPYYDGELAAKGYPLNKMCFSFNKAENRDTFKEDPQAYCATYKLTPTQTEAVIEADILKLLDEGGSIYYVAKLAGILGWNMQDIGAAQRGISLEDFKKILLEAGK